MAEPIDLSFLDGAGGHGGRRRTSRVEAASGRHVGSTPWEEGTEGTVDVGATLLAAALRRSRFERPGTPDVVPSDLRRKVRARAERPLIVFVVDRSESMLAGARMIAASKAAMGLLARAYLTRDRVAVVAFGGDDAEVVLEPTSSVALARERLQAIEPSGATPLASGLYRAWQLIRSERLRDPSCRACVVLLSDGEANVPIVPGPHLEAELAKTARMIRGDGVRCLVVDANPGESRSPLLRRLRRWLGSD